MKWSCLLLPSDKECSELYLRSDKLITNLDFPSDTMIEFNGYYNLFPLKTFREFTGCSDFSLHCEMSGSGTVKFISCDEKNNIVSSSSYHFKNQDCKSFRIDMFSVPKNAVALYWSLHTETECRFENVMIVPDIPVRNNIKLAAGICTFCREEFVIPNAKKISETFSGMDNSYHLFIADNGRTLDNKLDSLKNVTVLSGDNNGGSGGFARTIKAMLESEDLFTHMLLMDDDIEFKSQTLERTVFFLQYLLPEYKNSTIGGAMCLLEKPWIQFESGAEILSDGFLKGINSNIDLRNIQMCLENISNEKEADYQAWWYCCMSAECIRKIGLPMPFFIKMDDVEYALRINEKNICPTGIAVNHVSFESKYSPYLEYYIMRNTLITYAVHNLKDMNLRYAKGMLMNIIRKIFLQRYECAELMIKAYQDFIKGSEFLINENPEILNNQIKNIIPEAVPAEKKLEFTCNPHPNKLLCLISLNGMIFPCRYEDATVNAVSDSMVSAYRSKSVTHYYPLTEMKYTTVLNRKKAFSLIIKAISVFVSFNLKYNNIQKKWYQNKDKLSDFFS